jgi:hypothetical protein
MTGNWRLTPAVPHLGKWWVSIIFNGSCLPCYYFPTAMTVFETFLDENDTVRKTYGVRQPPTNNLSLIGQWQ